MDIFLNDIKYTPNRIFCIGRNYGAHARELNNEVPEEPVVFMKPAMSLVPEGKPILFPSHGEELHHEVEIVLLICGEGRVTDLAEARSWIGGLTLGLDLTLRDVQNDLKKKGLPWEKAKAFDGSAPIGSFISIDSSLDLGNISFECRVNDVLRQKGTTADMIFSCEQLLISLSTVWALQPGDLLFTGTPSGVGPLRRGDHVCISSDLIGSYSWTII